MSYKIGFYIAAAISFIMFIIISVLVVTKHTDIDYDIWRYIVNHRGSKGNALYYFSRIITEFGGIYLTIAIILVMGMYYRFDQRFFYLGIIVGVIAVSGYAFKHIFDRVRPNELFWWMKEDSGSYPSGHSLTAYCLYLTIGFIEIFTDKNKIVKGILLGVCGLFLVLIPISRLIIAVHYFTDVIGGIMWGVFGATIGYVLLYPIVEVYYNKIKNKLFKTE